MIYCPHAGRLVRSMGSASPVRCATTWRGVFYPSNAGQSNRLSCPGICLVNATGTGMHQVFKMLMVIAPTSTGVLPMSSITRRVTLISLASPPGETSGVRLDVVGTTEYVPVRRTVGITSSKIQLSNSLAPGNSDFAARRHKSPSVMKFISWVRPRLSVRWRFATPRQCRLIALVVSLYPN